MKTHSNDPAKRATQLRTGWTDTETMALVGIYDVMLALSAAGRLGRAKGQTSKAQLVRSYMATDAPTRSKGSVEAKLMNLSAVRVELGLPIVNGYKPLPNMSAGCRSLAAAHWDQARGSLRGTA